MSKHPFKIDLQGENYILVNYGYEVCVTTPEGEVEYLYTDTPATLIKEMSKKNKYRTIPYIRTSDREVKKRLDYINNLGIKDMKDLVAYLGELCKYIEEGFIDVSTECDILKGLFVESEDIYLESLAEVTKTLLKTLRKANIAKGVNFKNVLIDASNESMSNISTIFESFTKLGSTDKVEFVGENGKHLIISTEKDARDLYAMVYIHRSASFGAEYEVFNRVKENENILVTELSAAIREGNTASLELLNKYFLEVYERKSKTMINNYLNKQEK